MTTLAPYSWLRQLPRELKQLDEASPFGFVPPFDEAKFASILSETLKLENLQLQLKAIRLCEGEKILDGFADSERFFFTVAPLQGEAALLVPKGHFDSLLTQFAEKDLHHHILDEEFKKAFSHFVLIEALMAFQSALPDPTLSPQLLSEGKLSEIEGAWVKDIELSFKGGSLTCRLVLPNLFRQSLKSKYKERKEKKLFQELPIEVHIEAGRVSLSRQEWKSLNIGDWIILDSCHLLPNQKKGRVLLTIYHKPAFRARLKEGTLKILEYPLFYEVGTPMSTPPKDEEQEELRDEELEETPSEEEEEYVEEEEKEELSEEEEAPSESEEEASSTQMASQEPFKAEDIPLDIIVEVGRFQMTVQKLSELQPGSLIDLDIQPDQGVDLVVSGVCIAKGELLKVGETLGVRILDIAQ